jgi:putative transposase
VGLLFEARKRCGLCVLDYAVTSPHAHPLVRDQGCGEIASSMQLIAGRAGQGQAYNQRKRRRGAFWEDRYHATYLRRSDPARLH